MRQGTLEESFTNSDYFIFPTTRNMNSYDISQYTTLTDTLLTYLLTLLYFLILWCRILFEKLTVTQLIRKYPAFFMEPQGSSPCSQNPATGPYPDPAESSSIPISRRSRSEAFRNVSQQINVYPHAQPPNWRTTLCRLSATAYSIYSQLPSVSGGLLSIRNLRTRHAVVTRDPSNTYIYNRHITNGKLLRHFQNVRKIIQKLASCKNLHFNIFTT
jgi:hypothetical protein